METTIQKNLPTNTDTYKIFIGENTIKTTGIPYSHHYNKESDRTEVKHTERLCIHVENLRDSKVTGAAKNLFECYVSNSKIKNKEIIVEDSETKKSLVGVLNLFKDKESLKKYSHYDLSIEKSRGILDFFKPYFNIKSLLGVKSKDRKLYNVNKGKKSKEQYIGEIISLIAVS